MRQVRRNRHWRFSLPRNWNTQQQVGPINNGYPSNKQQRVQRLEKQPAGGSRSESATNTRAGSQQDVPNCQEPSTFRLLPIRLLSTLVYQTQAETLLLLSRLGVELNRTSGYRWVSRCANQIMLGQSLSDTESYGKE